MSFKFKKTNIQYNVDTPEEGWVILGIDENGDLVKKDDKGVYEKIMKDSTYGIYLRLETDYLTVGNRVTNSTEGLYSFTQGEISTSSGYISTTRGKYLSATNKYSYVSGMGTKNYPLRSTGINSFVHSYLNVLNSNTIDYGSTSDYSVILGGQNQKSLSAPNSSIIGGIGNTVMSAVNTSTNSSILGGSNNTISGSTNSTILGGSNNTISDGFNNVTVVSCNNVTIDSDDTLYTQKLKVFGVSKLNEGIVISGGTILSNSGMTSTNLVIGKDNCNSAINNMNYNTILGNTNAINLSNLTTSNNNVIIGYNNLNLINGGTTPNTNMHDCIIVGKDNRVGEGIGNVIIIGNGMGSSVGNTVIIGNGSITNTYLYGVVYTLSGTVSTSDGRLKTEVVKFTTDELNASKQLLNEIGVYEFIELVNMKGKHIGMTVQRVIEIMEENNLNPLDYSFISKDINRDERLNVILTDGYKYGLSYSELILFITRGIGEQLKDMDKRLTELENK